MPVVNKHKLYSEFQEAWEEVRDCVGGNMKIKGKREKYLPRLSGQDDKDYNRYIKKVKFFNATGRALDGLHGNVFRKAPEQSNEVSETFAKSLEDVDLTGTNIEQFTSDAVWDCLQTNWGGINVDYARGEEAYSLLDAENQGLRAYLKYYPAEQVINWEYKMTRGRNQLVLVVLLEPYSEAVEGDRFTMKEYNRYRVLYIDRETGKYKQDLYDEKNSLEYPVGTFEPKMNGEMLDEIPFYPIPGNLPEKAMLYDLAQLNLQHYQDTADRNNGAHYTSIPTPIAIGLKPEIDEVTQKPKPMYIGGTKFLFFPNEEQTPGADVKYLEFSGAGIKTLNDNIEHNETQMAILGAHIIAAEKKGVESAEALRIHRIGENGVLAAFVRNISAQITKACRMKGKWDGESPKLLDEWDINFNTDFDLSEENVQTLSVLLTGRVSGEIPRMSLYLGLKSLNLIPEQWDYETFLEELEKDREELSALRQEPFVVKRKGTEVLTGSDSTENDDEEDDPQEE